MRLNGAEFHLQVKRGRVFDLAQASGRRQPHRNRARRSGCSGKGEVFHGERRRGSYERASSGHRTGNRAQCVECHQKKDEARSGGAGAAPALCDGCHDRNGEKRYVHGPLAVGDCLACHDPHGGYGSAHLRQEQALLCGNCHAAPRELLRRWPATQRARGASTATTRTSPTRGTCSRDRSTRCARQAAAVAQPLQAPCPGVGGGRVHRSPPSARSTAQPHQSRESSSSARSPEAPFSGSPSRSSALE